VPNDREQEYLAKQAFANQDHHNWVALPGTQTFIQELEDMIAANQRCAVNSMDDREAYYARSLENMAIRKILDRLYTPPNPNIRNTPNGRE
jgi:hypothetical protein